LHSCLWTKFLCLLKFSGNKRNAIIKCCGRQSCTKIRLKTRNATSSLTSTTKRNLTDDQITSGFKEEVGVNDQNDPITPSVKDAMPSTEIRISVSEKSTEEDISSTQKEALEKSSETTVNRNMILLCDKLHS
jgi:hypothetical protein